MAPLLVSGTGRAADDRECRERVAIRLAQVKDIGGAEPRQSIIAAWVAERLDKKKA